MTKPELKLSFWDDAYQVINMSRRVQRRLSLKEIILETLRHLVGRPPTKDELQKLARIRRKKFVVALKELVEAGKIERIASGTRNDPFRYVLAADQLEPHRIIPKCV